MKHTAHVFHAYMTLATVGIWGLAVWLPLGFHNSRYNRRLWHEIALRHRERILSERQINHTELPV